MKRFACLVVAGFVWGCGNSSGSDGNDGAGGASGGATSAGGSSSSAGGASAGGSPSTGGTSAGGTSAGGTSSGGTSAGGASSGGAASGGKPGTGGATGRECESAADCQLLNDCCSCESLPASIDPNFCPADCLVPACMPFGDKVGLLCQGGRCILDVDCNKLNVQCRAVEPTCPDGQVPTVVNGCWGPCIQANDCPARTTDARP